VGEDPAIFLCSHGKIFDGMDQENSKSRGKGQIRKIQKNKKERKKEIVADWRFPYSCVLSPLIRNTLGLPPSCNPPSREPIPMGTSPTTKTTPSKITSNK
jgi:hypothetical protein